MIVTKTEVGPRPAGSELELDPAAEARLVQRGLAEWARPMAELGGAISEAADALVEAGEKALEKRTKAELLQRARRMGLKLDPRMTKAQIAEAMRRAS